MPDPVTAIRARLALEISDPAQSQRVALTLSELGFRIVQVGPRGVGFEGDAQLFQQVFQVSLQPTPNGMTYSSPPQLPTPLADLKASVYFPTKPEFFPQKGKFG